MQSRSCCIVISWKFFCVNTVSLLAVCLPVAFDFRESNFGSCRLQNSPIRQIRIAVVFRPNNTLRNYRSRHVASIKGPLNTFSFQFHATLMTHFFHQSFPPESVDIGGPCIIVSSLVLVDLASTSHSYLTQYDTIDCSQSTHGHCYSKTIYLI